MRLFATSTLAVVVLCATAVTASAAVPRIVVFSGPPLRHAVVVSNWRTIFDVFESAAASRAVPAADLRQRPSLRVSMFWGPGWNEFLASGGDAHRLKPRQADQAGRFYPAHAGRPAAIDLPWAGVWPRVMPERGLRLLSRLGVPIRR
jgi:hypothetical protein